MPPYWWWFTYSHPLKFLSNETDACKKQKYWLLLCWTRGLKCKNEILPILSEFFKASKEGYVRDMGGRPESNRIGLRSEFSWGASGLLLLLSYYCIVPAFRYIIFIHYIWLDTISVTAYFITQCLQYYMHNCTNHENESKVEWMLI